MKTERTIKNVFPVKSGENYANHPSADFTSVALNKIIIVLGGRRGNRYPLQLSPALTSHLEPSLLHLGEFLIRKRLGTATTSNDPASVLFVQNLN